MKYNREREVAVEAVREAARLCVDVRKSLVGAMEKDDRSPGDGCGFWLAGACVPAV